MGNTLDGSDGLHNQGEFGYGTNQYHHRGYNTGVVGSGYGLQHWNKNDWREFNIQAPNEYAHHYLQSMNHMIRGLDPDHHYEAKVQARYYMFVTDNLIGTALIECFLFFLLFVLFLCYMFCCYRNRYGWSDWTSPFVFSTSSHGE